MRNLLLQFAGRKKKQRGYVRRGAPTNMYSLKLNFEGFDSGKAE